MGKYYKISIIGSGNVAWHLSQALENAGHSILEIYSPNIKNAKKLCAKLYEAVPTDSLNFLASKAELFIIAVSDKAISSVAKEVRISESSLIVHTSGTESIETLKDLPNPYGVFYPIQSFSRSRKINFKEIPVSIESSDKRNLTLLQKVAESISKKVLKHSTEQRRVIHLACVFAANFTNHMFTISKGLLESNKLDFNLVKPLILEVVSKALEIGPENVQTGPAIRKDFNTINKHLSYLSEEQGLTDIYKSVTDDIIKTHD